MELEDKYEESTELNEAVDQILSLAPPELSDAKLFKFKVVFTKSKLGEDTVAKCTRLPDTVRFLKNLDFVIVISQPKWIELPLEEKGRILIHELYHIKNDAELGKNPKPTIRHHGAYSNGDFCKIGSRKHDEISYTIYDRLAPNLTDLKKFPRQSTLPELEESP